MASLNKVLLIGNLTKDPQLRFTPNGSAVADLRLAINRWWTGQDGQRHEETTFVDVTLWGRQAEVASEYLHKGAPVFIEGRLKLDQWQDKEGQNRSRLVVVGERMQFIGPRAQGARSGDVGEPSEVGQDIETKPVPEEPPVGPAQPPDDDLPF